VYCLMHSFSSSSSASSTLPQYGNTRMELSPIGLEYVLSSAKILALGLRTREMLVISAVCTGLGACVCVYGPTSKRPPVSTLRHGCVCVELLSGRWQVVRERESGRERGGRKREGK
jgi:hypothetical protein